MPTISDVSLGWLSTAILFIVALWKGLDFIKEKTKKPIQEQIEEALKPTNKKIDELSTKVDSLEKKIDSVDLNSTQNFLVGRIDELERGEISEIARIRTHEQLEHYTKLGGNSYIHDRFDNLKQEGKF